MPVVIFRASQGADSVSVQESVPPVGFKRLIVWARGFAPPAVPEKLRLAGLRSTLGVTVVPPVETTSVTGIVAVRILSYLPVTAMSKELLYVPVESPLGFTCTEIVSCSVEIVPDAGEIISQGEAAVAVQFFWTKDFVEKVTVFAGGLDVPSAAANVRVVGA